MTLTHEDHGPVVRIRHPEDLLALIPHQLGYRPRDACVLVVPGGDSGVLLLTMARPPVDVPPEGVSREVSKALEHLPGAADVIVVVYREAIPESTASELAALTQQWEEIAGAVGVELLTVLLVTPRFWWNPVQPHVARPITLVEDSPVNAQLVALGSALEPPAPGEDPRWQKALREKAGELAGPGRVATAQAATSGQEARCATTGGDPCPGVDAAPRGARFGDRPRSSGTPGSGAASSPSPTSLAAWDRTLRRVQRRRQDWVAAVLETPAADLRDMLDGLRDEAARTCLFYAWLCGDRVRAEAAWLALRPAIARVRGGAGGSEPDAEAVDEALRCVVAVAGEWEGPPHWESIEVAHRILQVLDGIAHARVGGGGCAPAGGVLTAETADTVVAALAQLEFFRGRAHTAARLLARCTADAESAVQRPGGAVAEVRGRLQRLGTPWWCTDPRTGWPGRSWWVRQTAG